MAAIPQTAADAARETARLVRDEELPVAMAICVATEGMTEPQVREVIDLLKRWADLGRRIDALG